MGPIKDLSNAVLQGAQSAAPSGPYESIRQSMAGKYSLAGTETASSALGKASGQIADDEEKRRKAAAAARLQEIQDAMDPSKYQKIRKDDGGFAFYDPTGKQIDISKYAQRTGQRRVDILKDSENPLDQQYISDWGKMNDISQTLYNGDTNAIEAMKSQHPDLFGGGVTPQQMFESLIKRYPHIYGKGSYQQSFQNLNKPVFNFDPSTAGQSGNTLADRLAAQSGY